MAELLILDGFDVILVDCGVTAIMLAQVQSPDLNICDIVMLGTEVLR